MRLIKGQNAEKKRKGEKGGKEDKNKNKNKNKKKTKEKETNQKRTKKKKKKKKKKKSKTKPSNAPKDSDNTIDTYYELTALLEDGLLFVYISA